MIEKKDTVKTEHPLYQTQQAKRDVFAAVQSTDTMRAAGERLLPKYPGEDQSEYKHRLGDATIDGITSGGVDTLTGAAFAGEIDTSGVHSRIQPLLENIDNQGNHFNVFARDAFKASFDGFSVVVVDMPLIPDGQEPQSLEEEQILNLRPYWRLYTAANVINWRFDVDPMTKQKRLALIVLREVTQEPAGRFLSAEVTRYRVWYLLNGVPMWELWLDQGTDKDPILIDGPKPLPSSDELPVALIGDPCDEPKLLVESRLEIKAYQKESSFDTIEYLSIPTFYTKGYPEDGPKLSLGASTHIKLPADPAAECGYVQIDAAGHDSLKGTIASIKDYIKSRLNLTVTQAVEQAVEKTATQTAVEDKDKQARLLVWTEQLHDALETALQYTGQMIGLGPDEAGEIVLKTKWDMAAEKAQIDQQKADERHAAELAAMKGKVGA